MRTIVISLGGSLVVPENNVLATKYLLDFKKTILKFARKIKFIIIVGGGKTSRFYAGTARQIGVKKDDLDWIGIFATRLNAIFVKNLFNQKAYPEILFSPLKRIKTKKIIFSAGWKPGRTTDYVSVRFCQTYQAKEVLNLTNIDYVYTKDPGKFKKTKAIKEANWQDYLKIIGKKHQPGGNYPFDPIASLRAKKDKIKLISINGHNLRAVENYLTGKKFIGTIIN